MKICYASDGVHLFDHMFLEFLLSRGHEVHLITFCSLPLQNSWYTALYLGLPKFNRLHIHHLDTSRIKVPFSRVDFYISNTINISILSYLLRKIKPDVLNGHWIPTYGFYSAASSYHPFLLTIWGSDVLILPKKWKYMKIMAKYTLRRADLVMVDSKVQRKAAEELGCHPDKIISFPWAVDLEKFNPQVNESKIREELGWEDNPVVFCARQHEEIYGIEYFIQAIPIILREVPDARFMIGAEGSLTEKFKQMVKEVGISKYTAFVGKIPHEKMPEFMAASDIYVSPSLSDGTSITLLEAMACAKPVVVSNIPGNLEWIKDGKNGLLVPVKDPSAIALAVTALLRDEELRFSFGAENREIVRKKANLTENLSLYERIMLKLAER